MAFFFACLPLTAAAAARTYALSVEGPSSGCPDADTIAASVRAESGYERVEGPSAVRFTVELKPSTKAFEARLVTPTGEERRLSAPSCEGLREPLAAVLVLALDRDPPRSEIAETATEAPVVAGPASSPREAPPPPLMREEMGVSIGARAWTGLGLGPALPPGAFVDVELRPRPAFGVSFGAGGLTPRTIERYPGTLSLGLAAVALDGCGYPISGRVELGACIGALGGIRFVEARGYDASRAVALGLVAPSVDLRARWALTTRFDVDAAIGALAPVTREAFSIEGSGIVERTPSLIGTAKIGLRFRLQ